MSRGICVLVIDAEKYTRTILEYNLRLDGFDVHLAQSGQEGIGLACEKWPEVILLGREMPDMDGLEVLAELKKDKKTSCIPVFIIVDKKDVNYTNRALASGADDYIVKPFEPLSLGETIERKLEECLHLV